MQFYEDACMAFKPSFCLKVVRLYHIKFVLVVMTTFFRLCSSIVPDVVDCTLSIMNVVADTAKRASNS